MNIFTLILLWVVPLWGFNIALNDILVKSTQILTERPDGQGYSLAFEDDFPLGHSMELLGSAQQPIASLKKTKEGLFFEGYGNHHFHFYHNRDNILSQDSITIKHQGPVSIYDGIFMKKVYIKASCIYFKKDGRKQIDHGVEIKKEALVWADDRFENDNNVHQKKGEFLLFSRSFKNAGKIAARSHLKIVGKHFFQAPGAISFAGLSYEGFFDSFNDQGNSLSGLFFGLKANHIHFNNNLVQSSIIRIHSLGHLDAKNSSQIKARDVCLMSIKGDMRGRMGVEVASNSAFNFPFHLYYEGASIKGKRAERLIRKFNQQVKKELSNYLLDSMPTIGLHLDVGGMLKMKGSIMIITPGSSTIKSKLQELNAYTHAQGSITFNAHRLQYEGNLHAAMAKFQSAFAHMGGVFKMENLLLEGGDFKLFGQYDIPKMHTQVDNFHVDEHSQISCNQMDLNNAHSYFGGELNTVVLNATGENIGFVHSPDIHCANLNIANKTLIDGGRINHLNLIGGHFEVNNNTKGEKWILDIDDFKQRGHLSVDNLSGRIDKCQILGEIEANQINLTGKTFHNQGKIHSENNLSLDYDSYVSFGELSAKNTLSLSIRNRLVSVGLLKHLEGFYCSQLAIHTNQGFILDGEFNFNKSLEINARSIHLKGDAKNGALVIEGDLRLHANGGSVLIDRFIIEGQAITLLAEEHIYIKDSHITTQKGFSAKALGEFTLDVSKIIAKGDMDICGDKGVSILAKEETQVSVHKERTWWGKTTTYIHEKTIVHPSYLKSGGAIKLSSPKGPILLDSPHIECLKKLISSGQGIYDCTRVSTEKITKKTASIFGFSKQQSSSQSNVPTYLWSRNSVDLVSKKDIRLQNSLIKAPQVFLEAQNGIELSRPTLYHESVSQSFWVSFHPSLVDFLQPHIQANFHYSDVKHYETSPGVGGIFADQISLISNNGNIALNNDFVLEGKEHIKAPHGDVIRNPFLARSGGSSHSYSFGMDISFENQESSPKIYDDPEWFEPIGDQSPNHEPVVKPLEHKSKIVPSGKKVTLGMPKNTWTLGELKNLYPSRLNWPYFHNRNLSDTITQVEWDHLEPILRDNQLEEDIGQATAFGVETGLDIFGSSKSALGLFLKKVIKAVRKPLWFEDAEQDLIENLEDSLQTTKEIIRLRK